MEEIYLYAYDPTKEIASCKGYYDNFLDIEAKTDLEISTYFGTCLEEI